MEYSFKTWERRRRHLAPAADRVLPLIASTTGMTRMQIGNAIKLDREVLNQLLDGMVGMGFLTVAREGGVPVYRAVGGVG